MDKSLIVNRDAAWLADVIKEDINAGFYSDRDEELTPQEMRQKKKKDYQRKYYLAHQNKILSKRKAAYECNHKTAKNKTTYTAIL